jgi:succinate dehydrogenase cytochrome b subunit
MRSVLSKKGHLSGSEIKKMAENTPRQRPRSPFLTIYRWPVTMLTSILHRVTGVGLALGMLLLACWLVALALGPAAYEAVQAFHGGVIGRFLLFGFSVALIYHLLNGVRHLFWDAGHGFDKDRSEQTGQLVLVASVIVTLAVWLLAYQVRG